MDYRLSLRSRICTSKARSCIETTAAIFLPLRVMSTGSIPYAARFMICERLRRSSSVLISGTVLEGRRSPSRSAISRKDGRNCPALALAPATRLTRTSENVHYHGFGQRVRGDLCFEPLRRSPYEGALCRGSSTQARSCLLGSFQERLGPDSRREPAGLQARSRPVGQAARRWPQTGVPPAHGRHRGGYLQCGRSVRARPRTPGHRLLPARPSATRQIRMPRAPLQAGGTGRARPALCLPLSCTLATGRFEMTR